MPTLRQYAIALAAAVAFLGFYVAGAASRQASPPAHVDLLGAGSPNAGLLVQGAGAPDDPEGGILTVQPPASSVAELVAPSTALLVTPTPATMVLATACNAADAGAGYLTCFSASSLDAGALIASATAPTRIAPRVAAGSCVTLQGHVPFDAGIACYVSSSPSALQTDAGVPSMSMEVTYR